VDDRTARIGVNHNIAGNPSRSVTGAVEIKDRLDWIEEQSSRDRWVATAVAVPFLSRYGYPFSLGRRVS
jgi:hypothetical protein